MATCLSPYFDPGPAYNNLPGADPINSSGANGGQIGYQQPVFAPPPPAAAAMSAMPSPSIATSRRLTWRTTTSTSSSRSPARPLSRRATSVPRAIVSGVSLTSASPARHRSRRRTVQTASRPFLVPGGPSRSLWCATQLREQSLRCLLHSSGNSTGKSNYNALQLSLRITGWHGITSIANYVWSRSMDNSATAKTSSPTPPT